MYKITCITNGTEYTLHDPRSRYQLISPRLSLEVNKAGTLTFSVPTTNPNREQIRPLASDLNVFDDGCLIFRGRSVTKESDFYKTGKITCEGDLAFLFDSMLRSYDYSGSISGFLSLLLENHNQQVDERKRIHLGSVTVGANETIVLKATAPVRTLSILSDELINSYGGYVRIRHDNSLSYLDYLIDFASDCGQKIEFRKNLVDLTQYIDSTAVRTVLIPFGAKQDNSDEYLTVESVNGGLDYVENASGIAEYGRIYETRQWADVTLPQALLAKAQEWLASNLVSALSIKLTAADLSKLHLSADKISLGDWITVVSLPHELNTQFLASRIDIDLANPGILSLTLGDTRETLTAANAKRKSAAAALAAEVSTTVKQGAEYNSVSITHEHGLQSKSSTSDHMITANGTDGFVAEGTVGGHAMRVEMSAANPFTLSIDGYDQIYIKNGILITSPYDINEDGYVDQEDLDLVTAYVLRTDLTLFAQYPKMDVNHDGNVSASDLTLISRACGSPHQLIKNGNMLAGCDSGGFYTDFNGVKIYRFTP